MLEINNISKSYISQNSNKVNKALSSITFNANRGDIISIYGPNGSGKSTLLQIIAGILESDKGNINFNDIEKKVGYVWQNYSESLFPWYSIEKNILLPNIINPKVSDKDLFTYLIELLEIDFNLDKFPYQLSGGEQQLIAIARALSNEPSLLILDEPFSALDHKKREKTFINLHKYINEKKPIVFFVSHNLDEAILFSNKLIILSESPAKILKVLDIDFNEERKFSLLTSPEFVNYRNQAINIINNGINYEV